MHSQYDGCFESDNTLQQLRGNVHLAGVKMAIGRTGMTQIPNPVEAIPSIALTMSTSAAPITCGVCHETSARCRRRCHASSRKGSVSVVTMACTITSFLLVTTGDAHTLIL